ncbi:MAG: FAD-dependent oxidoreductase [Anderseniella sp.]|jgi:D-amino-acid dehydrogenase|nr:FAD-dependent oxidoreductase [Anderseniella sp.]
MTTPATHYDLAIAGAGAVGLATALWAQAAGLSVALLDKGEPGSGASFGNAGTIATYACTPVNSPSVFSSLPTLLFNRDSPLRIDPAYGARHLPWLLAFLRNCTPARVAAITASLAELLSQADAGLDPLFDQIETGDLIVSNGCLYLYATAQDFDAAAGDIAARRANGVAFDILDEAAVKALEPAIAMPVHKALYFTGARHISDPGELMRRLHALFVASGGHWVKAEVTSCQPESDGVTVVASGHDAIRCDRFVVSAGAHSRSIAGSGAEALPLDTERGYHLMFADRAGLLSRPVGWARAGFYATPMTQGLRIAGTVEIAGLNAPPMQSRFAYLQRMAEQMLGPLGEPSSNWLGFRPTMPDALPVIGPSPVSDRVLFAFGHQHVGLTLSGITGKIIADIASGQRTNRDLSAWSPSRFG